MLLETNSDWAGSVPEKIDPPVEPGSDEVRVQKKPWRTPVLLVADAETTAAKPTSATESPVAAFGPLS